MSAYLDEITIAEGICAITGYLCLRERKDLPSTLLWAYVLLIFIAELTAVALGKHYRNNIWFYNLLLLLQVSFFFYTFQQILNQYVKSRLIIIVGLVLVLVTYGYDLINHGPMIRHHYSHTVFGLYIVALSLYFFYLQLISNEFIDLKTNAIFWWVAGTLFFFFPLSVINIFGTPLRKILLNADNTLYITFKILNILLYTSWTYAFICKKWETRS